MLNHLTILRAIAVIIVLIFHFDKKLLPSGYIGVDMFFVISGYLITMISLKRVHGINSLKEFYIKRIMRIFPALLFMSFFIIVGLSLIEYLEKETLQMIRDTILGNSNFRAEKINLDYFGDNTNNYFLHLWSISIELQFYLFFPLLLLNKKIKNYLFLVIISFTIILIIILFFFEQSYYSSFGRIFSFMGGVLSYHLRNKVSSNNYLFFIFLGLLIIISFFDMDVKTYPNGTNFLVVLLTALAILFGNIKSKKRYKLIILIGLISYSLYLWHYPLFLFFNHAGIDINILSITLLLVTLFLFSLFSYYVVEKRFIPKNYGNKTLLFILFPQILFMSILYYKKTESFQVPIIEKIYEKITLNPTNYYSERVNLNVTKEYKGCLENKGQLLTNCSTVKMNSKTKKALVLGNSFVHTGGLVFLDKITAYYNIKSDFFYLFQNKKDLEKIFMSVKAGKYDYLILYYPWLNIQREDLLKQYKDFSKSTQIIFVKGPKFNMDINHKQLFRFNNLFTNNNECTIIKPYTSDKGYLVIDKVRIELNAKVISIYNLQKNEYGNYLCSYQNIALFKDHFHMNNYAGKLFSERFIRRDLGKDIFD